MFRRGRPNQVGNAFPFPRQQYEMDVGSAPMRGRPRGEWKFQGRGNRDPRIRGEYPEDKHQPKTKRVRKKLDDVVNVNTTYIQEHFFFKNCLGRGDTHTEFLVEKRIDSDCTKINRHYRMNSMFPFFLKISSWSNRRFDFYFFYEPSDDNCDFDDFNSDRHKLFYHRIFRQFGLKVYEDDYMKFFRRVQRIRDDSEKFTGMKDVFNLFNKADKDRSRGIVIGMVQEAFMGEKTFSDFDNKFEAVIMTICLLLQKTLPDEEMAKHKLKVLQDVGKINSIEWNPHILEPESVFIWKAENGWELAVSIVPVLGNNLFKYARMKAHNNDLLEVDILKYTLDLCKAMMVLHQNEIFHNDLKLENILMKNDNIVVTNIGIDPILLKDTYRDRALQFKGAVERVNFQGNSFVRQRFFKRFQENFDVFRIVHSYVRLKCLKEKVEIADVEKYLDELNTHVKDVFYDDFDPKIGKLKFLPNWVKEFYVDISSSVEEPSGKSDISVMQVYDRVMRKYKKARAMVKNLEKGIYYKKNPEEKEKEMATSKEIIKNLEVALKNMRVENDNCDDKYQEKKAECVRMRYKINDLTATVTRLQSELQSTVRLVEDTKEEYKKQSTQIYTFFEYYKSNDEDMKNMKKLFEINVKKLKLEEKVEKEDEVLGEEIAKDSLKEEKGEEGVKNVEVDVKNVGEKKEEKEDEVLGEESLKEEKGETEEDVENVGEKEVEKDQENDKKK